MLLFLFFNKQTMHINSAWTTAFLLFPQKTYTLAEFEPGSSVPEEDEMSTAPGQFFNSFGSRCCSGEKQDKKINANQKIQEPILR
jgi:hypothetical protein